MVPWQMGAVMMCVEGVQSSPEERRVWTGRFVLESQTVISLCCTWAPQSLRPLKGFHSHVLDVFIFTFWCMEVLVFYLKPSVSRCSWSPIGSIVQRARPIQCPKEAPSSLQEVMIEVT